MNEYRKTIVHENLIKQLKIIKKNYPKYHSLSIPEISAYVKVIPIKARKESIVKRMVKILNEIDKSIKLS